MYRVVRFGEETGNGHVQLLAVLKTNEGIDNIDENHRGCRRNMIARGDMQVEHIRNGS